MILSLVCQQCAPKALWCHFVHSGAANKGRDASQLQNSELEMHPSCCCGEKICNQE